MNLFKNLNGLFSQKTSIFEAFSENVGFYKFISGI